MSVYFTYRRHNLGPSGKYTKRFDEDTVFDWFRNNWRYVPEDSNWEEETFGCPHIYGLDSLFSAIGEHSLPPPDNSVELTRYLRRHLYVEGQMLTSLPHCLQVLTNDDELDLAYYFYDDYYLKIYSWQAAYLLHDDWKLPANWGGGGFRATEPTTLLKPEGRGEGTTYLALSTCWEGGNLSSPDPMQAFRIKGVRLPELGRFLVTRESKWSERLLPLKYLRGVLLAPPDKVTATEAGLLQALRQNPDDQASWGAYSDWLAEKGKGSVGRHLTERAFHRISRYSPQFLEYLNENQFNLFWSLKPEFGGAEAGLEMLQYVESDSPECWLDRPSRSRVQVDEHVAHLCLNVEQCLWTDRDSFHQWLLFDDLWASAHPDLADSILRYVRRWDVLTTR
jgi:uncharacterized protein (TIGR02996 family)